MSKVPFGRVVAGAAVLAGGFALAACTTAEETSALNAIGATCITLSTASVIAMDVISSVDQSDTKVATTVSGDVNTTCSNLLSGAAAVIEKITGSGGTATVNVTTTTPAGVRRAARMQVTPQAIYVITPFHVL